MFNTPLMESLESRNLLNGAVPISNEPTEAIVDTHTTSNVGEKITVRRAVVHINAKTIKMNQRIRASGAILGKGNGIIKYRWVMYNTNRPISDVIEVEFINGKATIPDFYMLPTKKSGYYSITIKVLGSQLYRYDLKSIATYYVNPPHSVTGSNIEIERDQIVRKNRPFAVSGKITGTGKGMVEYQWMLKTPQGETQILSNVLRGKMDGGIFEVPERTLPTNELGVYHVWLDVKKPQLDTQEKVRTYTSFVDKPGMAIIHIPQVYEGTEDGNATYAYGRVKNFNLNNYKGVAAYILANDGWWSRPTWEDAITPIHKNGMWELSAWNNDWDVLRVYLIPKGFTGDVELGADGIPASFSGLHYVEMTREFF
jgi:hypothetical protein